MFVEMDDPQPLRLLDERSLIFVGKAPPLGAESLRDLRVVHLRIVSGHLPPLALRPDHERVHRALDATHVTCCCPDAAATHANVFTTITTSVADAAA